MKKIKILTVTIMTIIFIVLNTVPIYATEKNILSVTQKAGETKYLEKDQGYISKTIVDSNEDTGEVTIELALANIKKADDKEKYDNTEIFIIIPEYTDAKENEKLTYIETLANKIFAKSTKTKIGVIGIKGPIFERYTDEDGNLMVGENDQRGVNGTEKDAECIVNLTNDISSLKAKIRNMNTDKKKYYYNVQAALRLAKSSFSKNANKILISLYDNVSETAIGVKASPPSYGGIFGEYRTVEEAVNAHLNSIVTNTKSEVLSLKESNINYILLRPKNTSFDRTYISPDTGEIILKIDGTPYVNELYGTIEKPTYGKMYTLDDDNLEKIVTENIYNDVMETVQASIENVKVSDYFPKDIIENFEFEYVEKPSIGTVSEEINEETNSITWEIEKLEGNEVAKLRYKLKIKYMSNSSPIFNKEISTNEKVVLKYTDQTEKENEVILTSSPKIKLVEKKENINIGDKNNDEKPSTGIEQQKPIITDSQSTTKTPQDTTVAKGILPNTGVSLIIVLSIIVVVIIAIIGLKGWISNRDIK